MKIPLARPYMDDAIKDRVCAVLESGTLTEGPVTREFEDCVSEFLGVPHVIAATSCTTGLELALRALEIGPGDEVIVPDFTYPATADVVAMVGATVVLVDVSRETMLIDYDAMEAAITPRTRGVIPVSLFGNPLDYDRLNAIKERNNLFIIEDAACSLGAEYRGEKVGAQADLTVFSLHPRKFITTGEGGLIATGNPDWASWIRSYKNFGLGPDPATGANGFIRTGTNYKLSDILSAVGLVQMQAIDRLLARRLEQCNRYIELLDGLTGVEMPGVTENGLHSRQSFCIFVEGRDRIMKAMRSEGIEVQIGTYSLHREPAFADGDQCIHNGVFSGSDYAGGRCLALPLYHDLTIEDQECVVETLKAHL